MRHPTQAARTVAHFVANLAGQIKRSTTRRHVDDPVPAVSAQPAGARTEIWRPPSTWQPPSTWLPPSGIPRQ
jgi:hypothetical protein